MNMIPHDCNQNVQLNVQFPLQDGRVLVQGPLSYSGDRMTTRHNVDFLKDPKFQQAFQLGKDTGKRLNLYKETHMEYRVYICIWAAAHAMRLPGDFVECGVFTGFTARAICHYLDFEKSDKQFYLADTYCGIPADLVTDHEKRLGMLNKNKNYGNDTYDMVNEAFQNYPNVQLIKGKVPETLPQIKSEQVSFLSIDMNTVIPEIASAEYFWDKLVPGAMIVLDDYAWAAHEQQKYSFDEFARKRGVMILTLPTGQGLIVKP